MKMNDKKGLSEEDLEVMDCVCQFEIHHCIYERVGGLMMIGLRKEIEKNKHVVVGLIGGFDDENEKKCDVID